MKKILLACSVVFMFACSTENDFDANQLENKTTFDKLASKSPFRYSKEIRNVMNNGQEVMTLIHSSIPLEDGVSEEILNQNIVLNKANVKIEYYLNSEFLLDINIEDGMIAYGGKGYPNNGICSTCDKDKDGNIKDSMDCSNKGIKQCAFATYQQWSTAKIVYMSLTGGAQAVLGDCSARNCFGW